ncbi:PD-(D/E)XK nuclease family protein [Tersicoccus sp. MR15.9]|uniref:RecB family exonuclease n=1 Tax=Tersicoccus mangrovi TaxID=3121635 RepID=UPI002FE55B96
MSTRTSLLGDKVAWDGNRLQVTDESLIDSTLRRAALSPSTSKAMQSCGARWVAEKLLHQDAGPFDASSIGTSAHAVLETLYGLPAAQRTLATAEALTRRGAAKLWAEQPEWDDATRAQNRIDKALWISEVIAALQGIFTIEDPTRIVVYDREMRIDGIEIDGVPVNGFIDRIRYTKIDGVVGIKAEDFKTGKAKTSEYELRRYGDDHGDQVRLYQAALETMDLGLPVFPGSLLYTREGIERRVDGSPEKVAATVKVFKNSWYRHNKYMSTGVFPTKVSGLCGWCPLVNACPAAAEAGKTLSPKKLDGAPSAVALGIPTLRPQPAAEPEDAVWFPPEEEPEDEAPAPVTEQADSTGPETDPDDDPTDPDGGGAPTGAGESAEETADASEEVADAAHMGEDTTTEQGTGKDPDMPRIIEDKPWEQYTADGVLNPNSYTATGRFGTAELAVEQLFEHGQPLNPTNVTALNFTLRRVLETVQASWTGSTVENDGAATRVRGALRTVLKTIPLPFGQDMDAWDLWVEAATRRCKSIVSVATTERFEGIGDPWEALATTSRSVTGAPDDTETGQDETPAAPEEDDEPEQPPVVGDEDEDEQDEDEAPAAPVKASPARKVAPAATARPRGAKTRPTSRRASISAEDLDEEGFDAA